MQRFKCFGLLVTISLFSSSVLADDTPNIESGLWSHTTTTVIDSALGFPPQTETHQECLTSEDVKKGLNFVDIPEGCDVTRSEIKRDTMDYAMRCTIEGMATNFEGQARFHGDRMDGEMRADLTSPLGPMTIQTSYKAQRVGDC